MFAKDMHTVISTISKKHIEDGSCGERRKVWTLESSAILSNHFINSI